MEIIDFRPESRQSAYVFGTESAITGTSDEILSRYSPDTPIGKELRQHDARRMFDEIELHEQSVESREASIDSCSEKISALVDQQRLDAEYIISFGVPAHCRHDYRKRLRDAITNGQFSLKEIQRQTNAKWLRES